MALHHPQDSWSLALLYTWMVIIIVIKDIFNQARQTVRICFFPVNTNHILHLDLLTSVELWWCGRCWRWEANSCKRKSDKMRSDNFSSWHEGPPALGLPIMFKGELDFVGKDVGDKSLVVGAILALHLHQQLVIHAAANLLQPDALVLWLQVLGNFCKFHFWFSLCTAEMASLTVF